jgi:hypothetical protein
MYPNPQDVVALPARPTVEQFRQLAADLVTAWKADAIATWAAPWPEQASRIQAFARATLAGQDSVLNGAQFVVACMHGFESWPRFAEHLDALADAGSPIARFEAAADAIVSGDMATLDRALRDPPALAHARSTRVHRATLLIYTAANGVENYRQVTPANAVAIASALLDAGAEVDAVADMYGGDCTTLGLVATSVHPERAGVQNALMQLLIDRGAVIDRPRGVGHNHSFVAGCLANGRVAAAEFLADHGARLDLDGAAGVGRLDVVRGFFKADGTLAATATNAQMRAGFAWACEYGRMPVVAFLLDRGMPVDAADRHDGQTGLHGAALGGHADIVSLLLARNAPVNAVEKRFNGTPLTWALHGWSNTPVAGRERYYDVVARLVRGGATVKPEWLEHRDPQTLFGEALRDDTLMRRALTGGMRDDGTNDTTGR